MCSSVASFFSKHASVNLLSAFWTVRTRHLMLSVMLIHARSQRDSPERLLWVETASCNVQQMFGHTTMFEFPFYSLV